MAHGKLPKLGVGPPPPSVPGAVAQPKAQAKATVTLKPARFPSRNQLLVLPAADERTVVVLKGDHTSPYYGADTNDVLYFLGNIGCSDIPAPQGKRTYRDLSSETMGIREAIIQCGFNDAEDPEAAVSIVEGFILWSPDPIIVGVSKGSPRWQSFICVGMGWSSRGRQRMARLALALSAIRYGAWCARHNANLAEDAHPPKDMWEMVQANLPRWTIAEDSLFGPKALLDKAAQPEPSASSGAQASSGRQPGAPAPEPPAKDAGKGEIEIIDDSPAPPPPQTAPIKQMAAAPAPKNKSKPASGKPETSSDEEEDPSLSSASPTSPAKSSLSDSSPAKKRKLEDHFLGVLDEHKRQLAREKVAAARAKARNKAAASGLDQSKAPAGSGSAAGSGPAGLEPTPPPMPPFQKKGGGKKSELSL